MYIKKICTLCVYEKSEIFKQKVISNSMKRKGYFDEKEFYQKKFEIHKELQIKKDNINKAYNVKITNPPNCKRAM